MPGLLRGVVRTAAVAGTATAVSNRVSRRQARGARFVSIRTVSVSNAAACHAPAGKWNTLPAENGLRPCFVSRMTDPEITCTNCS